MNELNNNYVTYEAAISDLISLVENLPSMQARNLDTSLIVQNIWNLELLLRTKNENDFLLYSKYHMQLCIDYEMDIEELNKTILYKVSKYASLKSFLGDVNFDLNDLGEMILDFTLLDYEHFLLSIDDIEFESDNNFFNDYDYKFNEAEVKKAILFTRNEAYFSYVELQLGFKMADFKKNQDPFIVLIPYYFMMKNVDQYIKYRFVKLIHFIVESDYEMVIGFTDAFDQLSFEGFKNLFSYQYNMDIIELNDENDDSGIPF
jgi:hypothetical protein